MASDDPIMGEYGFWVDERTFVFDPPRRYSGPEGVSVVRSLSLGFLLDEAGGGDVPAVQTAAILGLVLATEPAPEIPTGPVETR